MSALGLATLAYLAFGITAGILYNRSERKTRERRMSRDLEKVRERRLDSASC